MPAHSIVYHHTEASLISCLQIGIHFGKRDDLKSKAPDAASHKRLARTERDRTSFSVS